MAQMSIVFFILFLSCNSVFGEIASYWRQFTGDIPKDAVIGGQDKNNKRLYIGRAYLRNGGVIPIEIKEGETTFSITWYGLPKSTEFVEILCGFQDDFKWLAANSTHFHTLLLDKQPVIGGYHDGQGFSNIGRINLNGEPKIGKIDSFIIDDAIFYCVDKRSIKSAKNYEVLVFERAFTLLQVD